MLRRETIHTAGTRASSAEPQGFLKGNRKGHERIRVVNLAAVLAPRARTHRNQRG